MTVESQALTALKWSAAGRFAAQAITWVITLFVIRLLNPADYGLMALVTVVLSISVYLADFGLGQTLVQAPELDEDARAKLAGLVILLHLAIGSAIAASAPLISLALSEPRLTSLVQVASLQFLFLAFGSVQQALAMRALNFKRLAWVDFTAATITALATLALALAGAGVWSLVLGNLVGTVARSASLMWRGEKVRPRFAFSGLGDRVAYGSRLAASQLSWLVVNQSDVLIGARLMSSESLGAYSVGLHLATLPMQKLMAIVGQVGFSAIARLQTEPERLHRRLLHALRLMTVVSVSILWGVSATAPEIVAVVLGPKWTIAILPLQLASLVVPLRMIAALSSTAVAAVGGAGTDLRNTIVIALIWPCCFFVGAHWGAAGLAASWLVAIPVSFALNFSRIGKVLGLRFLELVRTVGVSFVAGALMYAAVALARYELAGVSVVLRLAGLVLVGAATYLAVVSVLDRSVWADMRRLLAGDRG